MGAGDDFRAGLQALQQGDPGAALTAFDAVLEQDPRSVDATYLGAIALVQQGQQEAGTVRLRAAIALAPERASLHYNLGKVLQDRGEGPAAEAAYAKTLALDPALAEAHANLALLLKERGQTAQASAHFQRSFILRRRERPAEPPTHTTRMRLRHDLEQLDHLASSGQAVVDHTTHRDRLSAVLAQLPDGDARDQQVLTAAAAATLTGTYGRALHLEPGASLNGPMLDPGIDHTTVEARYRAATPNLCVVDNFLSPEGLAALRRHCLESTFWHDSRYQGGYLGAYWEQGFGSPLLVQLAAELRAALPGLLDGHPLQQLWAYKYDSAGGGIGVHADSAAVNVNLWLTPDDANQDPESGGLVIHHVKAPRDWEHAAYNSWDSEERIEALLVDADSTRVPHRQNRAVIFDSDLFHRTDRYHFAPGYLQRRLNVTLLFGWRDGRR